MKLTMSPIIHEKYRIYQGNWTTFIKSKKGVIL